MWRYDIVRDVAHQSGALLVDVDGVLTRASPGGLVGDDLFVDFVHPNIRAHQMIAAAVVDTLVASDVPVPAERWHLGAYVETPVETLYAADPGLWTEERLVRGVACFLARRYACALAEVDTVLAAHPDHPWAGRMRQGILRRAGG